MPNGDTTREFAGPHPPVVGFAFSKQVVMISDPQMMAEYQQFVFWPSASGPHFGCGWTGAGRSSVEERRVV